MKIWFKNSNGDPLLDVQTFEDGTIERYLSFAPPIRDLSVEAWEICGKDFIVRLSCNRKRYSTTIEFHASEQNLIPSWFLNLISNVDEFPKIINENN